VLLHNGNKFPPVPLVHAANMKESHENMKLLLEKIQYENYNWNMCGDLEIIALLVGLQLGYIKFCCFLCEWDSRDKNIITSENSSLNENRLFQDRKM